MERGYAEIKAVVADTKIILQSLSYAATFLTILKIFTVLII